MTGYTPPPFTTDARTSQYFANGIVLATSPDFSSVSAGLTLSNDLSTSVTGVELNTGGLYGNGVRLTDSGFYVVSALFDVLIPADSTIGQTVGFAFDLGNFYLRQSNIKIEITAAHLGEVLSWTQTLSCWSDVVPVGFFPEITLAAQQSIHALPLALDVVLWIDKVVKLTEKTQ